MNQERFCAMEKQLCCIPQADRRLSTIGLSGIANLTKRPFHPRMTSVFLLQSLFVTSLCARFVYAFRFGFYEDDYAHVTPSLGTHSFHLQTSLTVLLVAIYFYLRGWRVLSYIIISISMLLYESPFALFLAVPLLTYRWNRQLLKEILFHTTVLAGIALAVVTIRFVVSDSRVLDASRDILSIPFKVSAATLLGPATVLSTFIMGSLQGLEALFSRGTAIKAICIFSFGLTTFGLFIADRNDMVGSSIMDRTVAKYALAFGDFHGEVIVPKQTWRAAKLLLTGISMFALAYLTSFTHYPPTAVAGRGTSVHLAATFAAALVFAALCAFVVSLLSRKLSRLVVALVLALYFTLLVSYGVSLQWSYDQSWRSQQAFWKEIVEQCPDLDDGTVILVEREDLSETKAILTHSWADPIILRQIYTFPEEWRDPPRVFVARNDSPLQVGVRNGQVELWVPEAIWPGHRELLPNGNVILLIETDHHLTRVDGALVVQGQSFILKQRQSGEAHWLQRGPLYDVLINGKR